METQAQRETRKARTIAATQKRRVRDAEKREARFYAERQVYGGLTKSAREYLDRQIFKRRLEKE